MYNEWALIHHFKEDYSLDKTTQKITASVNGVDATDKNK